MIKYILIFIFAVLVAAIAQVMLKSSAGRSHKNALYEYLNPLVISAYAIIFISLCLTIYAYRQIDLKLTPAFDALAYVFVPMLSYLFLKERLSIKKCLGVGMIIFGIIVFNIVI